jgi:hypothetical protein
MINQKDREEVIKLLDNSDESVTLEDLFMFDLSPYYNEKKDESFFSKQLEFIQEKNELSHNKKISFTSEQIRIYNGIVENNRTIISAPTSFGKTMLVKEYIFNHQPNIIVFIVPTNSLADELLEDFTALFSDLGYTIFDSIKKVETVNDKSIFIGTQEKYYKILEYYIDKIDLFVIDEAYKLSDQIKGSREVILNRVFIDTINISKQIILLMPLVNSINGLEQLKFNILKSDYAPVAKYFNSIEHLDQRIKEDIQNVEKNNLIYFSSPKKLEDFYIKNLKEIELPIEITDIWIKRVEDDFHPDWLPIQALKIGIGVHYGPMPKFIQKKVIDLFNNSLIKNLLSTSSIIEGVNTPTESIYIVSSKDILGNKNLVKYKNLIGRAGRLGQHKVGYIYYDTKHKEQFEKANIPYEQIDIVFVLENSAEIIEINREDSFDKALDISKDSSNENPSTPKPYLEHSNYENVPQIEVSKLLNKHGFTVNQLKIFLDYVQTKPKYFLGIIGKIEHGIDTDCFNIVLNSRFATFTAMVDELAPKKMNIDISQIISSLIEMIYNIIPFKIIPLINFTIDINDLYNEYNGINLLSDDVIKEANKKKAQFYSKFIGIDNPKNESLIIINKLFEYGIPYQRVKPYLEIITEKLPNKFSIYDIKKIIFADESMNDLRVYFE